MGATVATFFAFRVLIKLDFPQFGYPMMPTEICFLSRCKDEYCLRSDISWPFPKGLLTDAWNARVGTSRDR